MSQTISFKYLNHNGKLETRTVEPDAIEFIRTINFGYQPGWAISGWDLDKKARRSFYLNRIVFEDDGKMNPVLLMRLGK